MCLEAGLKKKGAFCFFVFRQINKNRMFCAKLQTNQSAMAFSRRCWTFSSYIFIYLFFPLRRKEGGVSHVKEEQGHAGKCSIRGTHCDGCSVRTLLRRKRRQTIIVVITLWRVAVLRKLEMWKRCLLLLTLNVVFILSQCILGDVVLW